MPFRENEKPCEGTDEFVPSSIKTNESEGSQLRHITVESGRSSIQTKEFEGSQLSHITVESETCPSTPSRVLTPVECGIPHTLLRRVLVMPSDEALEGGYDSDGNVGPFLSAYVEYENIVSMDEGAPEEPSLLTPPPDNGVGSTPESVFDKETIKKMKVPYLRIALKARGLSRNGLKTVLIYQLKAAVGRGVPLI